MISAAAVSTITFTGYTNNTDVSAFEWQVIEFN